MDELRRQLLADIHAAKKALEEDDIPENYVALARAMSRFTAEFDGHPSWEEFESIGNRLH
jgi:hypothetical protein